MKKYLRILIITTIITLLPMLVGVILWNQLPDQMPIHWNAEGEVDGWGGKAIYSVFGTVITAPAGIAMLQSSRQSIKLSKRRAVFLIIPMQNRPFS